MTDLSPVNSMIIGTYGIRDPVFKFPMKMRISNLFSSISLDSSLQ